MTTEAEIIKKRIYVGNLGPSVTKDDLVQLFGLSATPYNRETCCVDMATDKEGKSKNFAYITVPEFLHSEIIKLNGLEFFGKCVVIEEAC